MDKIIFLLDELAAQKSRLQSANSGNQNIELALLQKHVLELYNEIQRYNKHLLANPNNTEEAAKAAQAPAQPAPKPVFSAPARPAPVAPPTPAPQPEAPMPPPPRATEAHRHTAEFLEKRREKLLREEEEKAPQQTSHISNSSEMPVTKPEQKAPPAPAYMEFFYSIRKTSNQRNFLYTSSINSCTSGSSSFQLLAGAISLWR